MNTFALNFDEALHLVKMEHDKQEAISFVEILLKRNQISTETQRTLLIWVENSFAK